MRELRNSTVAASRRSVSPTAMGLTPPFFLGSANSRASASQLGARPSAIDFGRMTILSLNPDENPNR